MDLKVIISFIVNNLYKIITIIIMSVGVIITYLTYRFIIKPRSNPANPDELRNSAGFAKILENRRSRVFSQFDKEVSDVERDPEASPVDRARARAYRLQKEEKIDEAIQEWRNIAKIAKGEDNYLAAYAWFSIGYLHDMEDRGEEALSAYDKAIDLDENYAVAYNNRAGTKCNLGRYEYAQGNEESAFQHYESAIVDYSAAIQLKRDFAEAYVNRGDVKIMLNRYEDAGVDYKAAIKLRTKYTCAYTGLAEVELHFKRYESAIAYYNKAIRLKRDDPIIYFNRGNVKMLFGEYEFERRDTRSALNQFKSALVDYNKALSLKSDFAGVYNNLGTLKTNLGVYEADQGDARAAHDYYESALADYNKAVCLDRNLAAAYAGRGATQVRLDNIEMGREDFQTALELARQQNQEDLEIDMERQILELDNIE